LQETGSFSQSVAGWSAGSYVISFDPAQRGNFQASPQDFEGLVDGVVVGTLTPPGTSYQGGTTVAVTAAAGAPTTTSQGLASAGGDTTAFIDAVAVAQASGPVVGDAGFEQPTTGSYIYAPTGTPWSFSGAPGNGSGVAANGSGFTAGNPDAPEGTQVAFLQGDGTISQQVAGWAAGSYTIRFGAAQRANFQAARPAFRVLAD